MKFKTLFCRHADKGPGVNVVDHDGAFLYSASVCRRCGRDIREKGTLILGAPSVREQDR